MVDPRPLIGEPLALDLLNTEWIDAGIRHDLLAEPGGVEAWGHAGADAAALSSARAAIRAALQGHREAINGVLAHGAVIERLGPNGPERRLQLDDERWRLPWLAAQNLLDLLREHPERLRRCANHDCVLHFYDTSRSGKRQWCSMASCGNRAKARRHYERSRSATP